MDDFDFPRGSFDIIAASAEVIPASSGTDELFQHIEENEPSFISKKSSVKRKSNTNATGNPGAVPAIKSKRMKSYGDIPSDVHTLTFRGLVAGMRLLGVVKEIHDIELLISLPNNLTGCVPITDISSTLSQKAEQVNMEVDGEDSEDENESEIPDLNEFFRVGQIVSCIITELHDGSTATALSNSGSPRKKICLSLMPSMVNGDLVAADLTKNYVVQAAVKSKEAHGYIIDIGVDGITGFLNKSDVLKSTTLKEGQIIRCAVKEDHKNARVVQLSMNPSIVESSLLLDHPAFTRTQIKPGALVNAKILKVLPTGLWLSFLDMFEGSVDFYHTIDNFSALLGSDVFGSLQRFSQGQKIKARVLYVYPVGDDNMHISSSTARIGLSLLPNLLEMKSAEFPEDVALSKTIDKVTVVRVDPELGLLVRLHSKDGNDKQLPLGYVHISRVRDERVDELEGRSKYKVGTSHPARVVNYDRMDGIVQLSMQPSVLNAKFLRHEELRVGDVIKNVEVVKVDAEKRHIIVMISEIGNIRAICPDLYLSDVRITKIDKRFKVGDKVTVRILSVDGSKKVVVALKKSLLKTNLPLVTSYDMAKSLIQKEGNVWVHGVITAVREYGCIVHFYNHVKGLLHFNDLNDLATKSPLENYSTGQVVKCRLVHVDVDQRKMKLSLLNLNATASSYFPSSKVDGVVNAIDFDEKRVKVCLPDSSTVYLPFSHLSDYQTLNDKICKKLKVGDRLEDLILLKNEKNVIFASWKFLLVDASNRGLIPTEFSQLKVGEVYIGYVRKIEEDLGAFVSFAGNIGGLVYKKFLSDGFVSKTSAVIEDQQSVLVTVLELDEANHRVKLSMRHCDLQKQNSLVQEINHILNKRFFEVLDWTSEHPTDWDTGTYGVSNEITMKVKSIIPNVGALLVDERSVEAFLTEHQTDKAHSLNVGENVNVWVLDADPISRVIDVSNKKFSFKRQVSVENKEYPMTIELVKEDYLILSSYAGLFFAFAKQLNNFSKSFSHYKPGMKLRAVCQPQIHVDGKNICVLASKTDQEKKANGDNANQRFRSILDYTIGFKTKAIIRSVKDNQLNVILVPENITAHTSSSAIHGRIHISEVIDSVSDIPIDQRCTRVFEARGLKQGSTVDVVVIGYHDAKTHRRLPITHIGSSRAIIELSVRPKVLLDLTGNDAHPALGSVNDLREGQAVTGYIQKVDTSNMAIWVILSSELRGRLPILNVTDDPEVLNNIAKYFQEGMALDCFVSRVNLDKNAIDLVTDPKKAESGSKLERGMVVTGRINKVSDEHGLSIHLTWSGSDSIFGHVCLNEIADEYEEKPAEKFSVGEFVRCINISNGQKQIELSLRKSRLQPDFNGTVRDIVVESVEDLTQGDLIRGYVKNVASSGLFVSLGHSVVARVKISDISDSFVQNWQTLFVKGQLVTGRILKIEGELVDLSLKRSIVDPSAYQQERDAGKLRLEHLESGQILAGTVCRVEKFGIFIELDNTCGFGKQKYLRGMCHKTEMADEEIHDASKYYSVGDRVQVIVLTVDAETRRINLGLKKSYFENQASDIEPMCESDQESQNTTVDLLNMKNNSDGEDISQMGIENTESSIAISGGEIGDSVGFDWDDSWKIIQPAESNAVIDDESEEDENENQTDKMSKSKAKRAKKRAKADEEAFLRKKEQQAIADIPAIPETAEDFDRLLLASPNSSYLWIQYMAFYLNMVELDKARQIAEKALKTINFREESEKFNIWLAYLNLENKFGTDESLEIVLKRALSFTEPKKLYLSLAKIYEKTERFDKAKELFKIILKKFKHSCKVWVQCGVFLYMRNELEEARDVLQRSLQNLPKRKHFKITTKFAQFEFKHGTAERGRTIFEGLLSNYPKRLDLWSIYVDLEIGNKSTDLTRRLFERVTHMKFSSKKMKFLFKRYLDFEKTYGTEETISRVVEAARNYVMSLSNETEENVGN